MVDVEKGVAEYREAAVGRQESTTQEYFFDTNVPKHFRDTGKAADMPKLDDRWNLGLWLGKPGVRRALCGDFSGSSQVSIHLETPRETTLGQEDVD